MKASVQGITPYLPGVSSQDVGRTIVKLSSNENPYGPPPRAVRAVKANATKIHLYPDKLCRRLKSELSKFLGVLQECLYVGNGSDEVLEIVCKLFLSEGDNIVTHSAFSTYNTIPRALGAERRLVPDLPELEIDVDGLMDSCDSRTKIMVVCTPNNPTGAIVDEKGVDRLLEFTRDRAIFLVLDEAYGEFSEHYASPAGRIVDDDLDAAVTRTFSKAFGLAGLRIGYAVAPARVIRYMDLVRMPFNVNSVAQAAGLAAMQDHAYVRACVEAIRKGRQYLADELTALGLRVRPSEANFVLVFVGDRGFTGEAFSKALLERGFAVRDCASFGLPSHVRISVGTEWQNRRLVSAISGLLA